MWKKCKFYFTASIDFWQKSFENKTCTKIISMLYRKPIQRKRISFISPNIFLFFLCWCPVGGYFSPEPYLGAVHFYPCWGDRDRQWKRSKLSSFTLTHFKHRKYYKVEARNLQQKNRMELYWTSLLMLRTSKRLTDAINYITNICPNAGN